MSFIFPILVIAFMVIVLTSIIKPRPKRGRQNEPGNDAFFTTTDPGSWRPGDTPLTEPYHEHAAIVHDHHTPAQHENVHSTDSFSDSSSSDSFSSSDNGSSGDSSSSSD